MEAAAEMVVDAACGHAVERQVGHLERAIVAGREIAPQQELERGCRRELRRSAEAAVDRIELLAQLADGLVQQALRERLTRRLELAAATDRLDELGRLTIDVVAAGRVDVGHRAQDVAKRGHAASRRRREVRAAPVRLAVRCHEHRHRPPSVTRERDDRVHVDPVDVRTLLAVDLDADEALVHERGRLVVLEGLVLHDVAPVARRVADGQQDRLVLLARARERLLAPRVPVDGVVRVLEEVRARLLREAVHGVSVGAGHRPARRRAAPTGRGRISSGPRRAAPTCRGQDLIPARRGRRTTSQRANSATPCDR